MRGTYFLIDESLNSTDLENAFIAYNGTGRPYSEVSLSQLMEENANNRVGRLRGIDWIFVAFNSNKSNDSIITFRQEQWEFSFAYALYISFMFLAMVFGFYSGRNQ